MKIYATDHQHSWVICNAMAEGTGGTLVDVCSTANSDGVVYGILRGCDGVMRDIRNNARDYFHIDHGYFRRGHYEGYYRVTKNGTQHIRREVPVYPLDRWQRLQIPLEPWKRSGSCVAVVPPTRTFANFAGLDINAWLSVVKSEIAANTDRPIVICTKTDGNFDEILKTAWAVVVYNSNTAVNAIVAGVPVIAAGPSCARPLSWQFEDLEAPWYPDNREEWCRMLSYHQFTVAEMKDGTAWQLMNEFG